MNDQVSTIRSQQAVAAAAAALICLVAILAMFTSPRHKEIPLSFSPGTPAPAAKSDGLVVFTAENILGLIAVGLVSGTFGGMLGMGGGVLKMSFLLLLFGFHPGISRFAALLSFFVVAVGASYRYLKLRYVLMDVVKVLIPSSVVGLVFGAIVGHSLPRDTLTFILGVFLLFIAVVMVRRVLLRCQEALAPGGAEEPGATVTSLRDRAKSAPAGWRIVVCGFPGGFLSAMLGISGGVISNPLQQVLAHLPIKNSIANTLLMASVTVPIACLMIMVMGIRGGHFDFWTPILVAFCLLPGSIIGSQLGPALTRRMSPVTVHALFGAVALSMGISMLFFSR